MTDSHVPDETLDLSGVPCPQNSARAILTLEWMEPGQVLHVIVDDGEPHENVPPSLREEGHAIIGEDRQGDSWILLVKRGDE